MRFVCGVMGRTCESDDAGKWKKCKRDGDAVVSKQQEKEEVDRIFKQLKVRHGKKI